MSIVAAQTWRDGDLRGRLQQFEIRVIDTTTNTVATSITAGTFTIAVDYARIKP